MRKMTSNCGIYAITSPSGKRYIGSSTRIRDRWTTHRNALRQGTHHSPALQAAFIKYGEDALRFEIIETCIPADLIAREQAHIDAYNFRDLYNVAPKAYSCLGVVRSEETKARVAAAKRNQTPETLAKISAALKGRKLPPHQVEALRRLHTGRKATDSAREKMSAARKGRKQSPAHVAARAAAMRGQVYDTTRIANMVAGRAGRPTRNSKTGLAGVYATPNGRFRARIQRAGINHGLGTFDTAQEARAAIMRFEQENP